MTDPSNRKAPPDLLQAVLDNPYEGTVIIDAEGIIRHFSKSNASFYNIAVEDAIGRHILEIVPNSGLPAVLRSGRAEVGHSFAVKDRHVIVNRYPLKEDGRVIGAVGKVIFHNLKAFVALKHKIKGLEETIRRYEREIKDIYKARYDFEDIIGQSHKMARAKQTAERFSASSSPVLLIGESGTGKELFAHAMHRTSPRREHAFIRVNCASIPGELFESELFGYEPGAFSGAAKVRKPGKFELAHKGTIFLDEIGDMPLSMQAKLLRVLQEKEVEPLGARAPKPVDFRVIAATNRDLEERVRQGYFRKDLFYRLNVVSVPLPPLREVREDIPLLCAHLLHKHGGDAPVGGLTLDPEVMALFLTYEWPGNVRELENVIERAISMCSSSLIRKEHLPESLLRESSIPREQRGSPVVSPTALGYTVGIAEKERILDALRATGGNRTEAAAALKIHRTTLYYKLRKYGLSPSARREST